MGSSTRPPDNLATELPGHVTHRRDAVLFRASCIAAAGLALWTYWPAFSSYLIDDDFQWIDGAMQLGASRALIVSGRTHFYRPILELYFGLMYSLSGCSAVALHVASVCIHIVNAWFVIALARLITGDSGAGRTLSAMAVRQKANRWPALLRRAALRPDLAKADGPRSQIEQQEQQAECRR